MQRTADCLVTGVTGFLGRSVASLLRQKSASVRSLVRRTGDVVSGDTVLDADFSRLEIVHGNLLSPTDMDRAVEGVRVVYHLAAETRGLPATIFAGTVVGSKNLLQAIVRVRPKRVVLVSSISVYGLANAVPGIPVTEDCATEEQPEKRDVYTHSKIWQEQLFREYLSGSGIELTVLRPGFIYGPEQSQLPSRLGLSLGNVLLQVRHRTPLPITYVENCANAVVFCGNSQEAANETYNIIDDDVPTASEYLRLSRVANPNIRVLTLPFWVFTRLAYLNRVGHKVSAGQIPLVITGYKAGCSWKGHRFSNQKLKNLGWIQPVRTREALERTFSRRTLTNEPMKVRLRGIA